MEKVKDLAKAFLVGIVVFVVIFGLKLYKSNKRLAEKDKAIIQYVQKSVDEVNKQVPFSISPELRVDKVIAREKTIVYQYFVKTVNGLNPISSDDVKASSCMEPEQKEFVKQGGSFEFEYFDFSGDFLNKVKVTKAVCNQFP